MRVLLDTGPLVAMLYRREYHHRWSLERAAVLTPPFFSCEAVLTEAHFLLSKVPNGTERLIDLLHRGVVDLSFSYASNQKRVDSLMVQYRNVPISFADACLVCMAELQESQLFTLDSDFLVYRTHKDRPLHVISP
jgi:uncharacterized protein